MWDGKKRPIRYMVKSKFWRRIGTDDGERFDKTNGEQRSCRATDKQPLPSSRKRELLLHLDQIGLQGRLVMRWLQIIHLGVAGPAVVAALLIAALLPGLASARRRLRPAY